MPLFEQIRPLPEATCPSCSRRLPNEDINIAADLARCRSCGRTFRLSDLLDARIDAVDLQHPPAGAWFEQRAAGFVLGATTRSPMAFLVVPFVCVWASLSLRGFFGAARNGSPPALFALPFLLIAAMVIAQAAMTVLGKVEVRRDGDDCVVFTGIGWLGWTRRFRWSELQTIREDTVRRGRSTARAILLEGHSRIAFGSMLSADRRYFLMRALERLARAKLDGPVSTRGISSSEA